MDFQVAFAAIDCTKWQSVCSAHDVSGYPTFKYFNYGKSAQKYAGGREVSNPDVKSTSIGKGTVHKDRP